MASRIKRLTVHQCGFSGVKVGHFIRAVWTDASSRSGWVPLDDIEDVKLAMVEIAGWVIRKTAKTITITNQIDHKRTIGDPLIIPRGDLSKIRYIPEISCDLEKGPPE